MYINAEKELLNQSQTRIRSISRMFENVYHCTEKYQVDLRGRLISRCLTFKRDLPR